MILLEHGHGADELRFGLHAVGDGLALGLPGAGDAAIIYGVARADLKALYAKKARDAMSAVAAECGRSVVETCMLTRGRDPDRTLRGAVDLERLCFPSVQRGSRAYPLLPLQVLPLVLARVGDVYRAGASAGALHEAIARLELVVERDAALSAEQRAVLVADLNRCACNRVLWGPLSAPPVRCEADDDDSESDEDGAAARYVTLRRRDAQALVCGMLLRDETRARVVCTSARPTARALLHKAGALPGWHIELEVMDDGPRVKRARSLSAEKDTT